jgi:hypothetical protein
MLWPTPYPMTSPLRHGGESGSHVVLPVVPPGKLPSPQFQAPVESPSLPGFRSLDSGTSSGYGEISSVDRNPQTGEVTVTATNTGAYEYPWGTETYRETIEHKTSDSHPENTSMTGTHRLEVTLPEREILWEAELVFRSDLNNFYYHYVRRVSENGVLVREKIWDETIPRDFQ